MRRWSFLCVVVFIALTATASASSWHTFSSKSLGFRVQYPVSWQRFVASGPGIQEVRLTYQGKTIYGVDIMVLRIKPAASLQATVARVVRYERGIGNTSFASIHWTGTSLGGRPAVAGISRPSTEGGVGAAQGIYLAPWHSRVYQVTISAYGRHAPSRIDQFPAIYRQVLATWRFL